MDPALAAPIATVAGAVATAILMWASYNYPRGYHRDGALRNEKRGRHRSEDEDDEDYDEDDEYEYEDEDSEDEDDSPPHRHSADHPR